MQPWAGMKIDKVAASRRAASSWAAQWRTRFRPASCRSAKRANCRKRVSVAYALEYGEDTIEMHADALVARERVVLVDDLIATGGTAEGAVKLLA